MTELRRLGATDLKIAPLVLGGNVFGWTADRDASFAVLDAFVAGGGTMIDTANVYSAWAEGHSGGESEAMIGDWLKASGKRDQVLIASKVGMLDDEGLKPDRIVAACDESLQRLGIDRIDLYYAHQDDEDVPQEDVLGAFQRLIDAGKIAVIGASNFHARRLKSAIDIARRDGLPRYHVCQPEYNLVNRESFEGELQDYCVQENIAVLPYRGLASGYLTGKYRGDDDLGKGRRSQQVERYVHGNGPAMLDAMDAIAAETGATLGQIALAWLMAQPGVVAPIASATSARQLDEIMAAMTLTLTPDQLERLDAAGA